MSVKLDADEFLWHLCQGAWLINEIAVRRWGMDVYIQAVYDPSIEGSDFELVFENCLEIQWHVDEYAHEEPENDILQADVIGMDIGEGEHKKPAAITTDLFEVLIKYDKFSIHKDW